MVVLQHRVVIVEQGQLMSGVDEKLICSARVVNIVNESGE